MASSLGEEDYRPPLPYADRASSAAAPTYPTPTSDAGGPAGLLARLAATPGGQ
jgi:hypothetical protein